MKKLALGTALWGWGVDKEDCFKLLDTYYENGERYIDTASNYPITGISRDRYASENIIAEWVSTNKVSDLKIIYKLGSIGNTNTPDNDLTPEFITKECRRISTKFGYSQIIPMIHWDNRNITDQIIKSLKQLIDSSYSIGFSGIKYPSKYSEALNRIKYNREFYIETKSNLYQSNIDHYEMITNNLSRIFAYGISISGVKLNKSDYSENSYVNMVRSKSFHSEVMTKELQKRIQEIKELNKNIESMYHIGIMLAELNKKLYGYIIGPRSHSHLIDILDFRKTITH